MSTHQTVNLGYGRVVLKTQTATYAPMRLQPPFLRDSAVTTARRQPRTEIVSPVSAYPQINGAMKTDDCTHPNGTIIMLQASKTRGTLRLADACILLRLREEAANLNVIARLPTGPDNLLGDRFSIFRGRADLLSPEEASVFRIDIPGRFIGTFFNLEEIEEMFEVHELAPALAPRPEVALVATAQGVVVKETPAAPTRRMRFRK